MFNFKIKSKFVKSAQNFYLNCELSRGVKRGVPGREVFCGTNFFYESIDNVKEINCYHNFFQTFSQITKDITIEKVIERIK